MVKNYHQACLPRSIIVLLQISIVLENPVSAVENIRFQSNGINYLNHDIIVPNERLAHADIKNSANTPSTCFTTGCESIGNFVEMSWTPRTPFPRQTIL